MTAESGEQRSARPRPLDEVDEALLRHLQADGRQTIKQLADLVHLSPSSCHERVRSLRARGIISGYHAHVDLVAVGRPIQALIAVRLRPHSRDLVERFREFILDVPETVSLFHVSGNEDFLVHIAVADIADIRRLVVDACAGRPEVAHVYTSLVFDHVRPEIAHARAPL